MLKYILQISFAFSVLILISCSQSGNSETENGATNTAENQRPKEPISYPEVFSDTKIPMTEDAYVLNKKELKNTKNKTGMQVWEKSDKSFDDVKAFYLEELLKNGWERKTDGDKQSTPEEEAEEVPIIYFDTKFLKEVPAEKKKFILMLNLRAGNDGKTTVIKTIKEM